MIKPDAATAGPVFFDPTGRRRRGLRAAAALTAGAAGALAAGVVIGLTAPAQAPPAFIVVVAPGSPGTTAGAADAAKTVRTSASDKAEAVTPSSRPAAARPASGAHKTSKGAARRRARR